MSPQTATAPTLKLVPITQIKPAPGNPRRQVGDVTELAASIRVHGILEPLLGIDGNGEGVLLVAGQRRLAAAKKAGLTEVPIIVRPLDAKAQLEIQLIENIQRLDLDPIDEAAAFKRLLDLGLSQTELGERIGRSQSHISKRLALLQLPDLAVKKLHAGGITLEDAVSLTKLVEHPERIERALKQPDRWNGVAGSVERELAEQQLEDTKTAARAELQAVGVKILKEEPWYSWSNRKEKPLTGQRDFDYDAIGITVAKHQKEPCHAAAIDQHAKVIYVCTNPKNHPGAKQPPRSLNQSPGQRAANKKRLEEQKQQREAQSVRTDFIAKLLKDPKKGSVGPFILDQFVQHASSDEARIALELLRGEKPKKDGSGYFPDMLSKYAEKGENELWRAGLALAFATGEMPLRSGYGRGKAGNRYVAFLQASGYKLKPIEKKAGR